MTQSITPSATLAQRLRERIKREGPITFRDWMDAALYDEREGYYRRHDRQRWGREGDYRTSPERSTLFSATFARYFAKLFRELNSPAAWTIVEVGAGDGRFARAVLETLQTSFPEVFAATRYVIDELRADPRLRDHLDAYADRVQFHSLTNSGPINPGIIFSNELLDAFPIHRVTAEHGQLRELYVTVAPNEKFEWTTGPLSNSALEVYITDSEMQLEEGQIADVNLRIKEWLEGLTHQLASGYLITVDYGAEASELYNAAYKPEGTLRAFHRHQLVDDVLANPGEQDITSTIDWTFVKRLGQMLGLETVEFERQDRFLLAAGLLEELELQSRRAGSDADRLRLSSSAREMILPNGLAASFQVLVQRKSL